MLGLGIGITRAPRPKRSLPGSTASIAASVLPASSVLTAGQTLADTQNWAVFLDPGNYATTAPGQTIASVTIGYTGDAGSDAEVLAEGDINSFTVTVVDTLGTVRVFTVQPRIVLQAPPVATGLLADQSLTRATGPVFYDVSGDFTGNGLSYSVTLLAGVSIDSATGIISFDTGLLALQSGTRLDVVATNSGGSATSGFDLTVLAPVVYGAGIDGLTPTAAIGPVAEIGVTLTGTLSNLQGGEVIVHRWQDETGLIAGATRADYTPVAGQDRLTLQYVPLVDGTEVASTGYPIRHAAPVAGMLAPVVAVAGSGALLVNLEAGFTGQALVYSTAASGVSISGTILTIADAPRDEILTVTATNSGGQATVDLSVTITAASPQSFTAMRNGTDLILENLPDISPQTFTATANGPDLRITFTGVQVVPAPMQILVVDAAHHDGTDPDLGSYEVQIFDLGTAQDGVFTLPDVMVPAGALVALIVPEVTVVASGETTFDRVVFVGASIMSQTFGADPTQRNTAVEALFEARGAPVEIYAHAVSNSDLADVAGLLTQAMADHPARTLFFVHAGGNDVSSTRPYPAGAAAITTDLDALIDVAATRPGSAILSDLTFRDYGDTTAFDEAAGSKPYNDAIYLPRFQARKTDLVERAYYADGTPVSCLYEWSYYNRAAYLSDDNVHPENPGGRLLLQEWLADRLAPICLGQPVPTQEDRGSLAPVASGVDLFIEYGGNNSAGVNTPDFVTAFENGGNMSDGPFDLLNTDTSDPGVTLLLNFSAPAPGDSSGFGLNLSGRSVAVPAFDGTLYNDVFTTDSFFAGAAYTVDHVISGLAPDTGYTVELVASRAAADSRETRYVFSNGETVTINSTANPVEAPVTVTTQSDGTGTITITQSANTGSWSYLSGLHIFDT